MRNRASFTALFLLLSVPACSSGEDGTSTAGGGTSGGPSVTAAATKLDTPVDAVPSPGADRIYFLAKDQGKPALFRVASPSSDAPTKLGTGFTGAQGVVVGSSGATVYVADPSAAGGGAIYAVPADGGMPGEVAGSEGHAPAALDLAIENGSDQLYFAGVDAADGAPAVLTLPAGGGSATVVAKGFPAGTSLQGVAKAQSGTLFVTGTGSDGMGALYAVEAGTPKEALHDIALGTPGGIALTLDESTLLVSSLAAAGTSQVILYDTAKGTTSIFDDVIKVNHTSGGVHRARKDNTFAWADLAAGSGGIVYRIDLK